MSDILSRIQYWGLLFLVFLLPLFFLPITSEFFDFNKMVLLVVGTLALSLIWAIRGIYADRFTFFTTQFDFPVIGVAVIFAISSFLRTPNKLDSFLFPGTATIVLASTLLFFLVTQTIKHAEIKAEKVVKVLIASGIFVSLVSIASTLGALEKIPSLPPFLKAHSFSLLGSPFVSATFLIVILVLCASRLFHGKRGKIVVGTYSVLASVLILGLAALGSQVLPGKPFSPRILPLDAGWTIAIETLKISPLGFGPGNFVQGFNQYRPLSYNLTPVWSTRFGNSTDWYLSLFAEVGILGLAAFLFLAWRSFNFKYNNPPVRAALFAVLVLFLLLPVNLILLFTFYLLLGLGGVVWGREVTLGVGLVGSERAKRVFPTIVLLIILGISFSVFLFGKKAYAAEIFYKKALDAAARNEGDGLFNNLVLAITENPRNDRYRIVFSQANLAIANQATKKEDIKDEDRQNIAKLVQEAIREAQIAVAINNKLSSNWENLARIYRALIPVARGADNFAVASYTQAIALEPTNPILRVNLGGVHYAAGRSDEAIKAFEGAISAKGDLANAHYSLGIALSQKGDIKRAITELERTLTLVDQNSKDHEIAQKELDALKNKLATTGEGQAVKTGETLEAPQPSPSPAISPQLTLPKEAGPPEVVITPSPKPSVNPNP